MKERCLSKVKTSRQKCFFSSIYVYVKQEYIKLDLLH